MPNINTPDKNELLSQLDRLLDWIKSCDTKASIVIAGLGLFLTLFSSENIFNILKDILNGVFSNLNFANLLYLILFFTASFMLGYGIYCLVRVLTPRLTKEVKIEAEMNTDSLYFFEAISKNNFKDFADKVKTRTNDDTIDDILTQIHINAQVCTSKYSYYRKGIKWGSIGLSVLLALFLIGVILVKAGGLL